jgi:hypothetical protein
MGGAEFKEGIRDYTQVSDLASSHQGRELRAWMLFKEDDDEFCFWQIESMKEIEHLSADLGFADHKEIYRYLKENSY